MKRLWLVTFEPTRSARTQGCARFALDVWARNASAARRQARRKASDRRWRTTKVEAFDPRWQDV